VAVLVDGESVTAADGTTTWQPRSEEELGVLRELVTTAAGLDESRGDVLTLKSLAFEPIPQDGPMAEAGLMSGFGPIDIVSLIQVAVLAVVALILGLFVVRPLMLSNRKGDDSLPTASSALALSSSAAERGKEGTSAPRVLTGEIADQDLPDLPVVSFDEDGTTSEKDPMARLRRLIDERQTETVEILRGWMETDEEESV
jgi:flagellar M-ring protein FliF